MKRKLGIEDNLGDAPSAQKRKISDKVEPEEKKLNRDDYTVGWICPLEVEQIAAFEMLDEEHERLPQPPTDHNVYNLGSINGHNVVIASLHQPGNNPAATVVTHMSRTFPNLKFGLLVGIGGGVPVKTDNGMIRLGDVVVSKPAGGYSGVLQYDHGKAEEFHFKRTGALAPPPAVLLNAAQDLAAKRARSRKDPIIEDLKRFDTTRPYFRKYQFPGREHDHLYQPDYIHSNPQASCEECRCDSSRRVEREAYEDDDDDADEGGDISVVVHRGTIASGEWVVKNGRLRDRLAEQHSVLCFEMEGAGALSDFPCIVIRGISDYCDSHKNDRWHGYAAAVAAVYARRLFFHMPIDEVKGCVSSVIEEGVSHLIQRQDDQEHRKISEWLTRVDYAPQQNDFSARCQEGTGQWLLNSSEFTKWITQSKQTLFCPGIPGAGKTMITCAVVEHLREKFRLDSNTGIAYLYCNFRRQEGQKLADLLSSLLGQLTQRQSFISKEVKNLYERHKRERSRPSIQEILQALSGVISSFSRTFIIIDALDEYQTLVGDRARFLSDIFGLRDKTGVNIFATSRFIPEITELFKGHLSIEIRARNEDINKYLDSKMAALRPFVSRDPALQEKIKAEIISSVDGMFLLAQLRIDSLHDKLTITDIKGALKKFRKESVDSKDETNSSLLDHAYGEAMERVESQLAGFRDLAIKVLSWITCAKRQLTALELQHALAVKNGETDLNTESLPEITDLISSCAGLITFEKESRIVRLVHYTTQKYFERTQHTWFPHAQREITTNCLDYLSFDVFSTVLPLTGKIFREWSRLYPFCKYAADQWGNHAREVQQEGSKEMEPRILQFLSRKVNIYCISQIMDSMTQWGNDDYLHILYVPEKLEMTGIHLTAYFGLKETMIILIEQGHEPNSPDSRLRTPLSLASQNGHETVASLLIKENATINAKDDVGRTALHRASRDHHPKVVQILLESGADTEVRDIDQKTALHHAAYAGHIDIVQLLLDNKAEIEARDHNKQTALHLASLNGHEWTVQVLLDNGADIEARDKERGTSLFKASYQGHVGVAQILLDNGADIEASDHDGERALHQASGKGHDRIVRMLLNKGADTEARNDYRQTALYQASEKGYEGIVRVLLDNGADIDARNKNDMTALHQASNRGQNEIVQILLDNRADTEVMNGIGETVLCLAYKRQNAVAAKLLRNNGADIHAKNEMGSTMLHICSDSNYFTESTDELMRLALDSGVDINAKDNAGETALYTAVATFKPSCGSKNIIQLLLKNGADVNIKSKSGKTALHLAVEEYYGEAEDIIRLMLEIGNNINIMNSEGDTPFFLAIRYFCKYDGDQAIVRLLLQHGPDMIRLNEKNQCEETVLHFAIRLYRRSGHEEAQLSLLTILLENSLDVDAKNRDGETALHLAFKRDNVPILRLLLEKGVGVNIKNNLGETTLHLALKEDNVPILRLLLEKGVDVNIKNYLGETALHLAVKNLDSDSKVRIAQVLIQNGVDVNMKNHFGKTALHLELARSRRNWKGGIASLLIEKKADVNIKDNSGRTALHVVVAWGRLFGDFEGIAKLLLDNGANPNEKDNNGATAFDLGYKSNRAYGRVLQQLLLEKGGLILDS